MGSLLIKAGDKMSFTLLPDGVVIMRVKNRQVSDLAGLLYKKAGNLCRLSCCRGDARSGPPTSLSGTSALLDAADLAFEDETSIEYALYSWKDWAAEGRRGGLWRALVARLR
jgi:hypothetical protein